MTENIRKQRTNNTTVQTSKSLGIFPRSVSLLYGIAFRESRLLCRFRKDFDAIQYGPRGPVKTHCTSVLQSEHAHTTKVILTIIN